MNTITISDTELAQVRSILRAHLPPGVKVAVFGSRAGGRVKKFSDLDLVLDGAEPLPWSLLTTLADAFDESLLPFKVDLIDRHAVSDEFGAIVDATKLPLS